MVRYEESVSQYDKDLLESAESALESAYTPYSGFSVGAAVRTDDGTVFSGANVENASYGLSMCAERTAIFKAVSEGYKDLDAIAIVGKDGSEAAPCGACRQVMREFNSELSIILTDADSKPKKTSLAELLPNSFGPDSLDGEDN
jgi:cytidine deaminase